MTQAEHVVTASAGPTRLLRAGAIAGTLVVAILLAGVIRPTVALPGLGTRNWLVVLFEINAGVSGVSAGSLRVSNPLDIAALVLVGFTFLGLWPVLGRSYRIWMGLAVALPFAGIGVLLATSQAGRSALMGSGLVIAGLMLTRRGFRSLAYLGILANALLLIGDFATGGSRALVVAALVGVGYILLIAWFVWIVVRLVGWGRSAQYPRAAGHT